MNVLFHREMTNYRNPMNSMLNTLRIPLIFRWESLMHVDITTHYIRKGEQIGTIGNVNGIYYAHLNLEIRTDPNMDIGGGYSSDTTGYTDPTDFINQHRNLQ